MLTLRHTNARGNPVGESNRLCIHPDSLVATARVLRGAGASYQQIADALGVPRSTAWRWCNTTRKPATSVRVVRIKTPSADQQSVVPTVESTACADVRKSSRKGVPESALSDAEIAALRAIYGEIA